MNTTRFNPTTNGGLHIGHAYTALVNQHEAHASGGKFILRFDDNTRYWVKTLGGKQAVAEIAKGQQADLEWLGIAPDEIAYQSEMESEVLAFLAASKWQPVIDHAPWSEVALRAICDPPIEPFGLTSFITAEKVVADHLAGVDLLIRGLELMTEDSLYRYFAALFGFMSIETVYIPRLMTSGSTELADVSKTAGNWKIHDVRSGGHSPEVVLSVLRESCLVHPWGLWSLDNLRTRPVLTRENEERLE